MPESLVNLGLSRLRSLGQSLLRIRYRWFVLLLISIELVRIGIGYNSTLELVGPEPNSGWPTGTGRDSSPLWIAVTWLPLYLQLHPVLTLALGLGTIGLISILGHISLAGWRARVFLLGVLASAVPLRLVEGAGHYDALFILGSVLIAFPQRWLWIVGALIAATSHSEAALVSGICVLLVGFAFQQGNIRQRGILLVLIGAASTIVIAIYSQFAIQNSATRGSLLVDYLGASIAANISWLPQTLATGYLAAWIVVVVMILSMSSGRRVIVLTSGLILLPALTMILTLDGTRVFVIISTAAFLVAFIAWLSSNSTTRSFAGSKKSTPAYFLGLLLILAVTVPETSVFTLSPDIRIPPWQILIDVYYAMK